MNKKAKIIGTGSYYPERILSNNDLEKIVDTSNDWIVTRTGILERRIAKEDEFTSDMGVKAAKEAIKDAEITPKDIDLIIVATLTPDYIFPSTSCLIQKELKAKNAVAVDIQAACSGFVYGLSMAKVYVETGTYKNVLIIASEKLSSIVNYKDRTTCVLFGDAASACIVSSEKEGMDIESICLGSDGDQSDLLIMPAGGCRNPASKETIEKDMHYITMNGKEVFKHAVRRMEASSKKCLELANKSEKDVSWLIPHQANERIIEAIAKRFNHLPADRVYKEVVHKFGNTSASSVGLALDILRKENKFKKNENILLTVFGAGFTWGAALLHENKE